MTNLQIMRIIGLLANEELRYIDGIWLTPIIHREFKFNPPFMSCDRDQVALCRIMAVGYDSKGKLCVELANNNYSQRRVYGLAAVKEEVIDNWLNVL